MARYRELSMDYVLVAAIDFGTTFSGYAFSFREIEDNNSLPEQIHMNTDWGEEFGYQSFKTSTAVLVDGNNELVDFGYAAEKRYIDEIDRKDDEDDEDDEDGEDIEGEDGKDSEDGKDDEDVKEFHLYRHFKMQLMGTESKGKVRHIAAVDGKIAPAVTIISQAIKYLKQHLLNRLKEEGSTDDNKYVRWVITVPAIWGEEAKQIMREAAYEAGCIKSLNSEQLVIALEPEAASLCCRRLNIAGYSSATGIRFDKGTKYLVVDCGGGTVDIAAHEILEDENVRELDEVSGGPWGGTEVDKNLQKLLSDLLGADAINQYRADAVSEWMEFMTHFETLKKSFKPDGESRLKIPIRHCLLDIFQKLNKKTVKNWLKETKRARFTQGYIMLTHQQSADLFAHPVNKIVDHVKKIMQRPALTKLDYIFMVGGFSECDVLKQKMNNALEGTGVRILRPSGAQLAIIKGAVLFGHKPQEIKLRISRYTYGSAVSVPFNPDIHDPIYRRVDARERVRCDDVLRVYIEKGDEVLVGSRKEFMVNAPVDSDCESISMLRYDGKPSTPVQYINTPGIREIGYIDINTPRAVRNRVIKVILEFGGTEMKVKAQFAATGEEVRATMTFYSI